MARVIALMALAALGLTEAPVHEPVHGHHSEHLMSTTKVTMHHAISADLRDFAELVVAGASDADQVILRGGQTA
jgi:hypothetical protein